jgi:hypothetical protein
MAHGEVSEHARSKLHDEEDYNKVFLTCDSGIVCAR